jgi:putative restriction endonuclease
MCGIQLRLVEAAHILPVADPQSTDETQNGVALCSLHHDAYDRNLISFTETYRIEVSRTARDAIRRDNILGGYLPFRRALRRILLMPANATDRPHPAYIRRSRTTRVWRG